MYLTETELQKPKGLLHKTLLYILTPKTLNQHDSYLQELSPKAATSRLRLIQEATFTAMAGVSALVTTSQRRAHGLQWSLC